MAHFFRIGDIVQVKKLSELRDEGIQVKITTADDDYSIISYCKYSGSLYSIFENEEHDLIGRVGIVRGGIYEKYLEVEVEDIVYQIPHFALKPVTKEVVELEENTYFEIEE